MGDRKLTLEAMRRGRELSATRRQRPAEREKPVFNIAGRKEKKIWLRELTKAYAGSQMIPMQPECTKKMANERGLFDG